LYSVKEAVFPVNKFPNSNRQVVIGWTGTRSTMVYLDIVRDVLIKLQNLYDFEFRVICDVDPHFPELKNYNFIKWSLSTEIEDLSALDIGLMPVPEGEWEQGKVGFKAIQYSGIQAVPVVSATGSGHEVVKHGVTGFVVNNDSESWFLALSNLLNNHILTESMGRAARDYIDTHYSVRSNTQKYLDLFN
jgi:glycosyltransferase involved in cell wall biosynthesis